MTFNQAVISLISAIVSGVLATAITLIVSHKRDEAKMRRDLAADLFGYRYQISNNMKKDNSNGKEFVLALNRVPIIFSNCKKVMKAYDKLYILINQRESLHDNSVDQALVAFLKEVCKASGINIKKWNENRISGTFNI